MSAKTDEYQNQLKQVLASAMSPEQARSAETFFSRQNAMSTGVGEFWSWLVLRYDCVFIYVRGQ